MGPREGAEVTGTTTRRPAVRRWLVVVAVAAAAAGGVLGVWADWTYPNPVYGVQIILLGGTGLMAVLGVLLRNLGPIGRAFAVSSVALLVGSVGGLVLSPPAVIDASGTMTLRVDRPEPVVVSGAALCEVHTLTDELSVQGNLGDAPPDMPGPIYVYLAAEDVVDDDLTVRADGLTLSIRFENFDTDVGGAEVGATRDSSLELRRDGPSGTLRFAELRSTGGTSGPTWLKNPALEGTVEWRCASE